MMNEKSDCRNFEFKFQKINCDPMTPEHIEQGWLSWMNDPKVNQYLTSQNLVTTANDLEVYLKREDHILFLACYDAMGVYFGNLRLYELGTGYASFGRLIGLQTHRGVGYGRDMVNAAHTLLFDVFNYNMTIVGNLIINEPSRRSKLALGYELLSDRFLESIGITPTKEHEYYGFDRSNYQG